jgi:aerobic carbon-monoxide dehydrogenase medium subunit
MRDMDVYALNYVRASSVAEAIALLKGAVDGKFLAGGMTLIPTLKQRLAAPSDLIDLSGITELRSITLNGALLSIGAMTTHDAVASSTEVRKSIPALATLAGGIGDPQVRNRGTIGGSIANNDPAADYPAAVLGLGATVHTDRRTIPADGLFVGMFETALEEDELITKVTFPVPEKAGYAKFEQRASRYALVGVMVSKSPNGVHVAVTGAGPCVFRMAEMEDALAADFSQAALDGIRVPADGLNSDMHGSAEYRAHLIGVMAKRAVAAAY